MNLPLPVYFFYLGLSWAIEIPLLVVLLRSHAPWRRIVAAGVLATAVTHPLLSFVWPRVVPPTRLAVHLASGEVLVALVEALVIWAVAFGMRRGGWRPAALASVAMNAASGAAGLVLNAFLAGG